MVYSDFMKSGQPLTNCNLSATSSSSNVKPVFNILPHVTHSWSVFAQDSVDRTFSLCTVASSERKQPLYLTNSNRNKSIFLSSPVILEATPLGHITTLKDFTLSREQNASPSGWRGLRRRCTAARLLRLWVRFPPGVWKSVCYKCCMLPGRGLCEQLITRPEESYCVL